MTEDTAQARAPTVVIGAGLAGLFAALKLAPRPVTVIAPAPLGQAASSAWAQGGIAAALSEGDTAEAHAADTIAAGAGLVDAGIARMVADEAGARVSDLVHHGVPFDRDAAGAFVQSKEAAHSAKRVARVTGDRAGQAIMQTITAAVEASDTITVLEGYAADDLIVTDGRVSGIALEAVDDPTKRFTLTGVDTVILATGGIGGLYATTTNPRTAVGAGIAMAARAGALIGDAEFVQFHPTAIQSDADPAPLASEALRGEGATLINRDGRRFMAEIHTDAELAPRDVVARAVFTEAQSERGAYLDTRQSIGAAFAEHFPTVYGMCVDNGIDPVHEPIPVIPAEHYHMGGVVTDEDGRTRVPNLFAIGEVACTGLHGANRLASNSLLEAVVFAARAAQAIASDAQPHAHAELKPAEPAPTVGLETREIGQTTIRDIMQSDVGVVRDGDGLRDAVRALGELQEAAGPDRALANMALTARFIAESALRRKESRGGHFRSDYPKPDPALAARKTVTLAGLDLRTGTAARAALTVAANPERGT